MKSVGWNFPKIFLKFLILVLITIIISACNGDSFSPSAAEEEVPATETSPPTETPLPTATYTPVPTATATPLPTLSPPDAPSAGMANLYGRVVFQGQPVEGFEMKIWLGVSPWHAYATTDAEGAFVFTDIPPGEDYEIEGIFEEGVLEPGSVGMITTTFSISADDNQNIGNLYLLPTDLVLLSPERSSTISTTSPTLEWKAYPGAAYYHLEFEQVYGNYFNFEVDTTETEYHIPDVLDACTYGWDITAYDADGNPLAITDAFIEDDQDAFYQRFDGLFTLEDESQPNCRIEVISPRNLSTIQASSGVVEFRWEPHPLATSYFIWIQKVYDASGNFDYQNILLERIDVAEDGSIEFPSIPPLARGQYNWQMNAYAEDGRMVAETTGLGDWIRFTIE